MSSWKIWVDTGGTFTDCLSITPENDILRLKVLSNGSLRGKILKQVSDSKAIVEMYWPVAADIYKDYAVEILGSKAKGLKILRADTTANLIEFNRPVKAIAGATVSIHTGEEVPVFAARLLTRTKLGDAFPAIDMKLGSTRGTNAILEKKGAKTALLITKGFKDLLIIGNQQRPDLFALHVKKTVPLNSLTFEVDERITSNGEVLHPLEEVAFLKIVTQLKKNKVESIAVAFLNSYKNPVHENHAIKLLREHGWEFVSASSDLSGQVKILQRAETAVANAYLKPIIHTYVNEILNGIPGLNLKIMSSAGGLVNANSFHPKDSLLSGPAGGIVGAAITGKLSGFDQLITFDMGGTSTDVSLYNRRFDYRYESKVGDYKILSPSLSIETIAAGGGSICSFDGHKLTVGPESAGAHPGPACYGAGGPLTITDVNLLLGKIDPGVFSIPLSVDKAQKAFESILKKLKVGKNPSLRNQVLLSYVQIANEKMAEAIRKVSTQSGHNPSDYALLCFGGAGGQHACQLAEMLRMNRIVVPYDAGLLSAYGIGHAKVERFKEKIILSSLRTVHANIAVIVDDLFHAGKTELIDEGYAAELIHLDKRLAFLRFQGQENSIEIEFPSSEATEAALLDLFRLQYERIFGHWLEGHPVEVESIRVIASVANELALAKKIQARDGKSKPLRDHMDSKKNGHTHRWEGLPIGSSIAGPAIIISDNSTTVVDAGWTFVLDEYNHGLMSHHKQVRQQLVRSKEAELELFTNRFTAIAQEMGAMLQRTSFSVNVKERLDFSCALLDRDGFLVVNAPHIPVHLGSLGVCVRAVAMQIDIRKGDVIITNHPGYGGSHLPDVTLIKGVFLDDELVGYVANRAHHAEIGGKKPGSMPADATTLVEEGVIIKPDRLVDSGTPQLEHIQDLFLNCPYPTRLWEENKADLNGALASVNCGEQALIELCEKFGGETVRSYMTQLRHHASALLQKTISSLPSRKFKAKEFLDDASILQVQIQKSGRKLHIDFTGSSKTHSGNLNATTAIVQSVVLYVLRLLVNRPVPMNEGLMNAVRLTLPHGLLNPDFTVVHPPAVVGGNTEVSQRLTDTLLKAFGLMSCSQGTMNNFLFGNRKFGYYETICGGTGAGKGFAGADAVHHHMTNTRITDPELLELRYPVRLERFEVRKNSGGKGKWPGGNGVVREFYFNEALDVNILSQHRQQKPYALGGGQPGKTGSQEIIRADGSKEKLHGMDSATVQPGDRLIIETPGGGGFGKSQ